MLGFMNTNIYVSEKHICHMRLNLIDMQPFVTCLAHPFKMGCDMSYQAIHCNLQ